MSNTPEHAIAIARVSSTKQRDEDQRPGLVAYGERKGYVLDEVVSVHGRSAFHGKHVKHILEAVEKHVRNGNATVVIFRHVDRSSREGVFEGFDLLKKIMDAGARVEFSEQEYLTEQPGMIGLFFDMAQKESEIKRDRKLQGNRVKRASGKMVGKSPWGYNAVLDANGIQVSITPNDLGRKWIPLIFLMATAGKSLRFICESLKGIPSPQKNNLWNQASVRRIIANTSYYGAMKGNPNLEYESLVTVELHKQANAAVEGRIKHGRSTVKHEAPLARPICGACYGQKRDGAPSGQSPMYVVRKTDKYGVWVYYRCTGHGPGRKGCGAALIPVGVLNDAVDGIMAADTRTHMTTELIAGDDNDERRSLINEKIKAATEAGNYELLMQLGREAMEIGPSARKATTRIVPSGTTVGQHWQTLTLAEKRDELLRWTVVAGPESVKILGPWHDDNRTIIGHMISGENA
jgi:DNA invertase Pin-like site-specific DNA recombinase